MSSLRERAYENFQQQIVEAHIRPGQFVSQRELMQLLDMPLGAVRELIPRLEAEGLLRTVPQRGLQIVQADITLVNNAFGLRRLIELEAARRYVETVSGTELDAVEAAHRAIVERARSGPIDDALLNDATAVDWGLHDRMVDALGNALVSQTYRINSLRVRLIRLEGSLLSADALLPAMEEHLWFLTALRRRDAPAVLARLGHHIDSAHRRVLGLARPPLPAEPGEAQTANDANDANPTT
ncbi:GntR family transcriptional regulator [Leptothrix discophora]|uniref:GntR family transcriptional regulator n=1 Tax=Leptothrix discophora TaxID=89 RepID=A0ABT9G455_LEPDI|nr:GntR family transcriptional regulator [Leptothrix discophora]MDP4301274.1 GntR family transcriptional regulator [Leptothrix discophora]